MGVIVLCLSLAGDFKETPTGISHWKFLLNKNINTFSLFTGTRISISSVSVATPPTAASSLLVSSCCVCPMTWRREMVRMRCWGNSWIRLNRRTTDYCRSCRGKGHMMTSSIGSIFRVTGPLCGEFTVTGEFPSQRPVTRSFDVFFDMRLNKPLS